MTDKLKVNTKTKISNFVDAQRAIQELQKNFNSLVEKALSPAEKEIGETEGSTGDIQITQNKDKTYTFEIRTESGWKTPVIGDSLIKFKDKPKSISQDKKEAIEDIEANDTTTGDSKANKTIYDEKNDKFVMPRADYDSGWVDLTDTDTVGTHNLGVIPSIALTYWTNDSGTTIQTLGIQQSTANCALQLTATAWGLLGNDKYGWWANGSDSHTAIDYTGYKLKVLLWK